MHLLIEKDILSTVFQRVKVLGAHEVGHSLGLTHNFAGSSYHDGFGSVMDYPPPIVTVDSTGTKLILNNKSYANNIGYFDKVVISYGYRDINDQNENINLMNLINEAESNGYLFLTDEDSDISGSDWRVSK